MYVKILELSIWAKKGQKDINKTELYRMYNNGLVRHKHESYLCLKVSSVRAFATNTSIEKDLQKTALKWLDILHEFLNDTEYQKEKQEQEKELQKMRNYFENLEIKNEPKNRQFFNQVVW